MIGILPRILILAIGCLFGYLLASSAIIGGDVDDRTRQTLPRAVTPSTEELLKESTTDTLNCEPTQVAKRRPQPDAHMLSLPVSELPETVLPAKYHRMIEPESREPRTLAELYMAFLRESRDDAWAAPVEAQINEVIAVSGVQGIQAEYVSCGSSRCTVAGYVDSTLGFDSCSVFEWIGEARIFPRAFGGTCEDEEMGGLQRFLVLIDSERLH